MLIIPHPEKSGVSVVTKERSRSNLYASGKRVTCIRNLSQYEKNITDSSVEEKFPVIGKSYTVRTCRNVHITMPYRLTFYEFDGEIDHMDQPFTFSSNWFVPELVGFSVMLATGINIRQPGYKEQIQKIYDKGLWKPKKRRIIVSLD